MRTRRLISSIGYGNFKNTTTCGLRTPEPLVFSCRVLRASQYEVAHEPVRTTLPFERSRRALAIGILHHTLAIIFAKLQAREQFLPSRIGTAQWYYVLRIARPNTDVHSLSLHWAHVVIRYDPELADHVDRCFGLPLTTLMLSAALGCNLNT